MLAKCSLILSNLIVSGKINFDNFWILWKTEDVWERPVREFFQMLLLFLWFRDNWIWKGTFRLTRIDLFFRNCHFYFKWLLNDWEDSRGFCYLKILAWLQELKYIFLNLQYTVVVFLTKWKQAEEKLARKLYNSKYSQVSLSRACFLFGRWLPATGPIPGAWVRFTALVPPRSLQRARSPLSAPCFLLRSGAGQAVSSHLWVQMLTSHLRVQSVGLSCVFLTCHSCEAGVFAGY